VGHCQGLETVASTNVPGLDGLVIRTGHNQSALRIKINAKDIILVASQRPNLTSLHQSIRTLSFRSILYACDVPKDQVAVIRGRDQHARIRAPRDVRDAASVSF
jgi:hypothetical protein